MTYRRFFALILCACITAGGPAHETLFAEQNKTASLHVIPSPYTHEALSLHAAAHRTGSWRNWAWDLISRLFHRSPPVSLSIGILVPPKAANASPPPTLGDIMQKLRKAPSEDLQVEETWLQSFHAIRTSLESAAMPNDLNELRTAAAANGPLAIVTYLLEQFPDYEATLWSAFLVRVPADSADYSFGLVAGDASNQYEIWRLREDLSLAPEAKPTWRTAILDRFSQNSAQLGAGNLRIQEHSHAYLLRGEHLGGAPVSFLTLINSRLVEHDVLIYPEYYKNIKPITVDIRSRSLHPLDTDGKMISYIYWLREFRRRRTVFLRLARPNSTITDDVVVRISDAIGDTAKDWLYRHPRPPTTREEPDRRYWPVTGDALEVLRFLIGWGYVEIETHRPSAESREQIENYKLFVGVDDRFYVGKGYRYRGFSNVNAYPKERVGSRLGAVSNYAQIVQPTEAEIPELFHIDQFGYRWASPEKKVALDKPYLSDVTLNTERDYNRDPASHPLLKTDVRSLRSWLLVMDVWLRNVDPKFTNLFMIDIHVPGMGKLQIPMKIDADFQMHPDHLEITKPRMGNPFEREYLQQKLRYWAFDPAIFDASAYSLDAILEALAYVGSVDLDAIFREDPELLNWQIEPNGYIVGEVLSGIALFEVIRQARQTIERDVHRIFTLMTGETPPQLAHLANRSS